MLKCHCPVSRETPTLLSRASMKSHGTKLEQYFSYQSMVSRDLASAAAARWPVRLVPQQRWLVRSSVG